MPSARREGQHPFIAPRASGVFLGALLFTLAASLAISRPGWAKDVHPALARVIPHTALSDRFLTYRPGAEPVVNLLLRGTISRAELEARGIEVNTWTPAGMTARCPLSQLPFLASMPGISAIQPAGRCRLYLDRSAVDADVAAVRTPAPPGFAGQSGAGVLVGIVDSGVDLQHGDFRNPDGSTRLISLWDQTGFGIRPAGFSYGVEWTPAQINNGSAKETDGFGHGTHVLGVAAGDGSSASHGRPQFVYVGMAPGADICAVKTDLTISGIVDGINYIFQKATQRGEPAVVNLSLGTQEGPHDGTHILDQLINQLTGPGRIVVAASGNEGADGIHAQVTLTPTTSQDATMTIPAYTPGPGAGDDFVIVGGWYSGLEQISVTLTTPNGTVLGPVAPGDSLTGQATPDGFVDLGNGSFATSNGDREIYLQVYDQFANRPPAAGAWRFHFAPIVVGPSGRVDAYIETSNLGGGAAFARWSQGLVFGGVVGAPGDADSVIAVAAHVTRQCWDALDGFYRCFSPAAPLGSLGNFSSQGPRRDGAPKPDISAPGVGIMSSRSRSAFFSNSEVATDGTHVVLSGTSMSTPHVTGAVALLLAHRANAAAPPSRIKARLQGSARIDSDTGTVPNDRWGAGKLDVAAALGPALTVSVTRPTAGHVVEFANSDSVDVRVTGGAADSVVVRLSKDGGQTYGIRLGAIRPVTPGVTQTLTFTPDPSWQTYRARVRCVAYNATMGDAAAFSDSFFLIQPEIRTALRVSAPNPFRGKTTIYFELLEQRHASVRVFSARGNLVRTLADKDFPPGRYALEWDGSDERGVKTSSGIYFCEFRSGSVRDTRRLVMVH